MDLGTLEADLRRAIGRRKVVEDHVSPALVERLAVTLECEDAAPRIGAALPPAWHTIFCLQAPPRTALGEDGLPRQYDLIPPVPMQRRLFGGARLEFHAPLVVGETVTCESELADVKLRTTSSAQLAVTTLRHRFSGGAGLAVVEEQDVVHMEPLAHERSDGAPSKRAEGGEPRPAPTWQRALLPDPVMLFRFAALTFNSHRIHYDRPYTEDVEKLPGLVVQGKLIALLLMELVRRGASAAVPRTLQYRSTRPLYAGSPCTLAGRLGAGARDAQLWAQDAAGAVVQTASVTFADAIPS
ncbi:MAG: MaoC family dehydratase N-terminal domain-containing protein [Hyphomicrobiales bacterium]|nr:MaoC family dehydratase N-terminal domain-containing protein [Hyphomicrobiales bacterium]